MAGISANTMAKLSKNENVSLDVLSNICRTLSCTMDEFLELLQENYFYFMIL